MTRRELITTATRATAAVALASARDMRILAQTPGAPAADRWGKDRLLRLSQQPPDYETPVALLDSFITPLEHFYVRSHMPVPTALDAATWRLTVDGEVDAPASLSVADLRRLPAATVTVTLECAGNGRAFFSPAVAGIQWKRGAVGTARWTGARLRDVLALAKARASGQYVHVAGADRPPGTMPPFVRQVPIAKALHEDTIVAYEMNGQPVPPVHGFPLRLIVPGWEGAYAMKWLNSVRVSTTESDSFWVATGYRYPTRRVAPGAAVDARDMAPLIGLAVKSLITTPLEGAKLPAGPMRMGGFAWAGEIDIAHVDVSMDAGASWERARLTGEHERYAWRRFEHTFTAKGPQTITLLSRATDANGVVQPAVAHWNPSGYLWNQYDVVRVEVA